MNKSQLMQKRRKALKEQYNVKRFELYCDIDEWESIKKQYDKRHLLEDGRKKSPG